MRPTHCIWLAAIVLGIAGVSGGQAPDPAKLKTAVVQWVADMPNLTYDIRFTGDTTTMPTALKYLVKDLAEYEGWYLTGEDKTKTIASRAKRISLEYVQGKSKIKATRVAKIDVKETPKSIDLVATFAKKPSREEVSRLGGILATFSRKYAKIAKNAPATLEQTETAKVAVWSFQVRFDMPPAKVKK